MWRAAKLMDQIWYVWQYRALSARQEIKEEVGWGASPQDHSHSSSIKLAQIMSALHHHWSSKLTVDGDGADTCVLISRWTVSTESQEQIFPVETSGYTWGSILCGTSWIKQPPCHFHPQFCQLFMHKRRIWTSAEMDKTKLTLTDPWSVNGLTESARILKRSEKSRIIHSVD